jgi:hypothetical protein
MTIKEKINIEYKALYNTLKNKVDVTTLNSIKGRIFAHRKSIDMFKLNDAFLNAKSENEVYKIFDKLNSLVSTVENESKIEKTDIEIVIDKFPKKFQKTIINIVEENKKEPIDINAEEITAEKLTEIYNSISNLILAIESQKRDIVIINAKTIEEIEDVLKRTTLVSRANKWSDLAPSKYRSSLKNELEKFADIISDFEDFNDYRKSFMKKANIYNDSKSFFNGLEKFVSGAKDDMDKIIDKINEVEGAEIEVITNDVIVAWIYTKNASVKLGSSQWCISYSGGSNYFNSYVFNNMNKQYFIWDFTKSPSSNNFRIGVTLNADGKPSHAHLKNDSSCLSDISRFSWFKYIKPLSFTQMKKWISYLADNNIQFPNAEVACYASIDSHDFDLFKKITDSNYTTFSSNKSTIFKIVKMLIDENLIDYIKYLNEKSESVISGLGQMFIYAYDNNKTEIFKYFRSLITPELLSLVEKISKTFPEYNKFIEYYELSK